MKRIGLWVAVAAMFCGSAAAVPHYDVQVGIRPDAHRLDATVIVRDPPSERFFVYKKFIVQSVIVDGKPAAFHVDPSAQKPPFTPDCVGIVVEAKGAKTMEVRYGGTMDVPVGTLNMITPRLVELASYAAWYPVFDNMKENFTYRLTAALPESFVSYANAKPVSKTGHDGRAVRVWESLTPSFDIALVAAPDMHVSSSAQVEVAYRNMPSSFAESQRDVQADAQRRMTALLGPSRANSGIFIVFTPRGGGTSYSRLPLMVICEDDGQAYLKKEGGEVVVFRVVAHELSHYWWMIAPYTTQDDWINEGLAEYSSVWLTEQHYGKATADRILDEFRQSIAQNKTADSILETKPGSPDRGRNLYQRPALMFFAAREKYGAEKFDAFLRDFYGRFAGTRGATTEAFLAMAAQHLGPEAAASFKDELNRRREVAPAQKSAAQN